jgi:capsid protein
MSDLFANSVAIVGASLPRARTVAPQPATTGERRWEAAETTRLNQSMWAGADGAPINSDIALDMPNLWARAAYEAQNNPTVEGVIETHATDIVGPGGPTLQVQSSGDAYNEAAERVWKRFFYAPTPNPRFSGASLLKLWIRALWKKGPFLAQIVTVPHADGPVKMRIQPLHASRLVTPMDQTGNPNIFGGIEFDPVFGVPLSYYIAKPTAMGQPLMMPTNKPEKIPAADIIHEFIVKEEGQASGCPWLASGLQTISDVRGYDGDVLDCAKQAALAGVYWFTNHVEAPLIIVNETADMERMQQRTGPPGYEPRMMTPQQPSQNHVEYRHDRQGEVGRPVGMPEMIVRHDASKHNYAGARFDDQGYGSRLTDIQSWISGTPQNYGVLNRIADLLLAEARFTDPALRNRPDDVAYGWGWPVRKHVDPSKERVGERIGVELGNLPFNLACRQNGLDEDTVFALEKRTNDKRAALGLTPLPPPGLYLSKTGGDGSPGPEPDDDETTVTDKKATVNG